MSLQLPSTRIETELKNFHDVSAFFSALEQKSERGSLSFSWIQDYLPVVSTIVTLFKALENWLDERDFPSTSWDRSLLPSFKALTRESSQYWRSLVVSIPGLGNASIIVFDIYAKIRAENILKSIPSGIDLSDKYIDALKQAAGYGCSEAMVRLAQFYIWKGCKKDADVWISYDTVTQLYRDADNHGHIEAQKWLKKYSFEFWKLSCMKEDEAKFSRKSYKDAFQIAIHFAQEWCPQLQKQFPLFEEVVSFCLKYPNAQTMTLLKKLCDKVEKNHTCDTAQVREKIATFEKENLDGTVVNLEDV